MIDVATPDLLETIVAAARRLVASRRAVESQAALERRALARPVQRHRFTNALCRPAVNVIAECKRRSPSRGVLCRDYDPVSLARAYAQGGAAAISVLTEPTFFDGSLAHLTEIRAVTTLPLLRKDFIVDSYQLLEARAAGADAVLLIVAALSPAQLAALHAEARALELDVLVEVHDEEELGPALEAGATIVGVNNRNLRTLAVDSNVSTRLGEAIPDYVIAVSESGLKRVADVDRLRTIGYRAFLIGETLASASDPAAVLRQLRGEGQA